MSRNSSVAVLADCTDLSNIHDSLLGLNGPPSVLSIENETILTNNSDISPSQVIGSGSFLERVKSTDLATLFPRGSLNQKRKKKKKSSESSLCISQSSENISSLQSNINVTETDENVSASFEGSSENKKMEPDEKSTKPFNKHLYLRKKSVNISLDSSSLNNSISEKSLKRNSRVVNVSLDPLYSKRRKVTETDENISDSFKGSRKSNQIKEESAKVFSKRSYLKKKSVNFSFDSSSLNNSVSEKSLETDQINKISLPSKRKNASRKCKLNSDLNIDDLESVECSEKNYTSTKGESIPSSNIDSSYIQSNKETNGSQLKSAKENEFDESISRDNVNGSLEAVNEESPKVFNKNVYLKKKSINISFDSSSLNNSIVEKSHEENSPVSEVSLDPSCSKIANVTGSVKNISAVAEVSQKMEIDKESANVFNKNLFLKKKPIDVTFDSSSINDSITEKISEGNSQVENVSLELSSKMEIEDSAKIFKKDLYIKKKSIKLSFDSSSLSDLITEKSLGGNNVVTDISLDPLSSEITNALKSTESVSKELIILKNSDETTNGNLNASNTVINNSSENDNDAVIDKEKKQLTTENHQGSYNEVVLSKDLVKETTKDGNTELMEVQNSNNSVNDSVSGCNLSQSSQICNAITNEDENRSTESEVDTNISLNDLLKAMDEGTAKVSNKNLCLKESIDIPFESSSLSDSISEKSIKRNILVTDVSSGPLSSEIANATDSSADSFKSLKLSFDSSSSNDPISEKSLEENSPITEVTLDPSCSEITNVTESVEKVSAPFRDAQKMIIEEDSAKVFNKNLYLKKKSIKLSFDSSSLSDPITEKSHDGNSGVTDSSSDPLSSKITNVTESALNVSASSEGSPKMENEEESAKVFCKNLYLKKKSINLTFDSSTLNDLIPEKNLEENSPPTEVSLNLLCPKTANVTESVDNDFASVEGSPKMEVEEESAKVFNKNMYLKKKSIKLTFDSSSLNDAIPEMCPEQYAPVTDVPVELMSSKIVNNTDSAEDNSFGGSQKIEIEEGSVKVFNKNLYLKKKSIKLSFDESSLNDPVSEKSNEEKHQVDNSTLDPISSKSTKIIDLGESTSATFQESRKMEIGEESAEVFNKNLYLKKKSVNISFDESSMNDPVPEKNNEENHQVDNGSLDAVSSKSTKIIDLGESTSATFQESQKMDIVEESAEVFNKNLYLKKKSINISFDESSRNDLVTGKSNEENHQVDDGCLDPILSKSTKITDLGESASATFQESQKMELVAESAEVFNKNLYLKKKSINISFDESSLNNPVPEKNNEENHHVDDGSLDAISSKSTKIIDLGESTSATFQESQKMDIVEESAEVFNKNLYLKKKSIDISFDVSSMNDLVPEKSNEENHQVDNGSLDPLLPKSTKITDLGESTSATFKEFKKMEIDEESAEVFNKNLCLKKSINISFDESSLNDPVPEKSLEENSPVTEVSLDPSCSKTANATESAENVSAFEESKQMEIEEESVEELNENTEKSPVENYPVDYVSLDPSSNVTNVSTELLGLQGCNDITNDPSNRNINVSNTVLSNSANNGIIDEGKNKSITDIHSKILTNKSSNLIFESVVVKDNSEGNSNTETIKSIPSSINIRCSKINEHSYEFQPKSSEGNSIDANMSKHSRAIENKLSDENSKLISTSIIISSSVIQEKSSKNEEDCFKEITSKNNSFDQSKHSPVMENSKHCPGGLLISHASPENNKKDHSEENSKTETIKSIPTSINIPCSEINEQSNEFQSKSTEGGSIDEKISKHSRAGNSGSKHVFVCPDVPAHNLRERSRKDTRNHSDILENSAKKNKSSLSGNRTEDFIQDISIIPNPKPFTRSRVMYHSTPISRTFVKENRRKSKGSTSVKSEDKNIQQDDKMIQVSKSIFGSSTEVTNATVSRKKSIEFSNNSCQYNEKSDKRTFRKSASHHSGMKKLEKIQSIGESRSYHSNFLSTFEDDNSYCTPRKSLKRVAFKSISSSENSSSGYGNSSDDYVARKRRSVRFRGAISLIEDTIDNSSPGDIRDANNSKLGIADRNSIGINDMPSVVNDSKSRIDRNDLSLNSLNYSAEVPEIILTEDAIEPNEISEDCSLFNKLIEMAEYKKSDRNTATRQAKQSRYRKKLGRSSSGMNCARPDLKYHEKWVSPKLIAFLNEKLMTDSLDHVINTERIVSVLCSAVSAVRNLQDANDIDFALLPLKNILVRFRVCCNMIEYCTFISRFTPFEFQCKTLPLGGYFGSTKRDIRGKLTDPLLSEAEKIDAFL